MDLKPLAEWRCMPWMRFSQHPGTKDPKPQPYRCRDCRYDFSAKTGSLMQGSPLGFQAWVLAIYLLTTSIKGVSSMKLHRDLGVRYSPPALTPQNPIVFPILTRSGSIRRSMALDTA